jgi:hypothetical protein
MIGRSARPSSPDAARRPRLDDPGDRAEAGSLPGQTTGAYVAVNHQTHDFVCKYGGLLVLTGLVCLALGEGIGPLVAGIMATCTIEAFASRLSRGTRNR